MIKKTFIIFISIFMIAIFTISCGSGGDTKKDDETITVGFSMDTLKEERWHKDRDIFVAEVERLGGKVLVQAANGDDALQISQAENLISQGVDVLVIVPHNAEAGAAIVNKAKETGIPVIAYDRLILNSDVDLYISFDSFKIGALQASEVVRLAPKGNYVYIGGSPTDNNSHVYRDGAMSILKPLEEKGDIKIVVDQLSMGWRPEEAQKHMENALTKFDNDIQGVVAANDGTAGGAIQALSEQGLAGIVPISGQDADLAAAIRIADGLQTMTVYNSIKLIAEKAANSAVALAKKESIEVNSKVNNNKIDVPTILLEPIIINKDNLNILIEDGFHDIEDVYKNVPENERPNM